MWATATGKRLDRGSVQFSPMYISSPVDWTCEHYAYYPLQPNTPDGNMAWMAQLHDWREKNRDSFITATTGFPLHPGGVPPGSGEYYGCGHVGHCRDSGLCTMETLNPHEHTFQTICRCILHAAPAAQVNLIEDAGDKFSWLGECTLMHTVDQGNGEGSSA